MLDLLSSLSNNETVVWIIAPAFLLGFLILIHESGHFLFAKLFGVGVEKFSFGFGPRIVGRVYHGTEYRLSWIPLGGYVKMVGDDPFEEVPGDFREESFLLKPVWQRLLIVLAGPLFNLLLPILLFAGLYMAGSPEPTSWVGMVTNDSPAAKAGVVVGDTIVAVDGRPIRFFDDLRDAISDLPLGATTELTLSHHGQQRTVPVKLRVESGVNDWGERVDQNTLGVTPTSARAYVGLLASDTSPAYRAGLRPGDLLLSVNGQPVSWWFQVEELLRSNTAASITVMAERDGKKIEAVIPRSNEGFAPVATTDSAAPAISSEELGTLLPGAPFGLLPRELFIKSVEAGKPADAAGLRAGDMIYSINGTPVRGWLDVKRLIGTPADQLKSVVVLRDGGLQSIVVKPDVVTSRDPYGRAHQEGQIGIRPPDVFKTDTAPFRLNPVAALGRGAVETATVTYATGRILMRIITGEIPLTESLGGPISIVTVAAESAWNSVYQYIRVMALVSVSLGIMNLLPIPLLDGGHILFFALELFRGRPVSMRFREVSQQVGLIILFILMAFAFANDVRMQLLR